MLRKLLGDLVKIERQRRNLSQNSLAEQSGISLRTISDIETYKANPRFETLCSLVQVLNISLDSIMLEDLTSSDNTLMQILDELEPCTQQQKRLALYAVRGLVNGFHEQDEPDKND